MFKISIFNFKNTSRIIKEFSVVVLFLFVCLGDRLYGQCATCDGTTNVNLTDTYFYVNYDGPLLAASEERLLIDDLALQVFPIPAAPDYLKSFIEGVFTPPNITLSKSKRQQSVVFEAILPSQEPIMIDTVLAFSVKTCVKISGTDFTTDDNFDPDSYSYLSVTNEFDKEGDVIKRITMYNHSYVGSVTWGDVKHVLIFKLSGTDAAGDTTDPSCSSGLPVSAESGDGVSGFYGASVSMSISQGNTPDGNSDAGAVAWNISDVSQSASLDSVSYSSGQASSAVQIIPIEGGNKYQGPNGDTDVVLSGSTLKMSYYSVKNSNVPVSQLEIQQISNTEALITKRRDGVEVGKFTIAQADGQNGISILNHATRIRETKTIIQSDSNPVQTITQTYEPQNGQGCVVSNMTYCYQKFSWGTELASSTDNQGQTTNYYYNTDSTSAGYKQLKSIDAPNGKWVYYQYDNLPVEPITGGSISCIKYTPFKNGSKLTSDPLNQSFNTLQLSGVVAGINYKSIYASGYMTYTDGKLTSRNETASGTESVDGVSLTREVQTNWYGVGGTACVSSTTYSYPDTASPSYLKGKIYLNVEATGKRTKYSYAQGTYDASTGTFTAIDGGVALLTTVIEGSTAHPGGIPYKTTKTETVTDAKGNQVSSKTYLMTDTAPTYELMTTIKSFYDSLGNLIETRRKTGDSGDEVVTYSASYYGNVLLSSTGEFGVVTTPVHAGLTQGQMVYDGVVSYTQTSTTDSAGRMISQVGSNGLVTSYTYESNASGASKVTVTRPDGGTSVTEYFCDGQVSSIYGTVEIETHYDYNIPQDGFVSTLKTQTDGTVNRTITTTADMIGRTTKITAPVFGGGSITSTSAYDFTTGLLKTITLGDGTLQPPTAYGYDELGRQQFHGLDKDGDGQVSISSASDRLTETDNYYWKDTAGNWFNVIETKVPGTSGMLTTSKQLTRVDGLQTISIDQNGTATTNTLSVDRAAQRVTVNHTSTAFSGTSISIYACNSTLLQSQEARFAGTDTKTTYQYDDVGRLVGVTDPLQRTTQISYVPSNTPGAGLELTRMFPDGSTRTNGYNSQGLLVSSTGSAVYPTWYSYNGFGEMVSLTTQQSAGQTSTTQWQRDPGTGLVSSKQYPDGNGTTYTYDAAQQITSRAWARGVTTSYTYTAGDLTGITYNDGTPGVIFGNYQRNGKPGQIADASGRRALSYSDYGDLAGETYASGGLLGSVDVQRTYSGAMRQTLSASVNGASLLASANYNYNSVTHLLDGITQGNTSVSYGYTPHSRLLATVTTAQPGASLARSIAYDAAGQLTSLVNNAGAATLDTNGTPSSPILYDNAGRRTKIPREDGSQWAYGYNNRGEVTSGSKVLASGGAQLGFQFGYQYDDIGNRVQTTVNGRNSTYLGNILNQYTQRDVAGAVDLTGSANPSATVTINDKATTRQGGLFYAQLAVSNSNAPIMLSATTIGVLKGAAPDGKDIVAQSVGKLFLPQTPEMFTYDNDGNLTQDGRWIYTWDGENRLIAMESIPGVPASAKAKVEFTYSAEGKRIQKRAYHWNQQTSAYELAANTRYVYDRWNVIAEMDATNAVTRSYLWGQDLSGSLQGAGGVGGLISITTSGTNGGTYLVSYDVNGNVLGLLDNQGNPAASYEYGPFGEPLRVSGAMAVQNPFRFSTKYTDDETGLLYYGYRYYNPSTGRWISRDPIEEQGGFNLYCMVGNNPLCSSDYLGLWPQWLTNLFNSIPKALASVKCNCKDICDVLKNTTGAIETMTERLNAGGLNSLDELLEGLTTVGNRGLTSGGTTGAGNSLPQGQKNIVNYFEGSNEFNNRSGTHDHPNPLSYNGNKPQFTEEWGWAEVNRLSEMAKDLQQEANRRKCNCN